jgi:DNA-binding transcriptional ArsR family regulator
MHRRLDVGFACAYAHMHMKAATTARRSAPRARAADDLEGVYTLVARYFGLLAEPTRLKILHAICSAELPVSAVVAATGASQSNVSRHLSLLHLAGVVSRRKQGSAVYYRVADPVFADVCRTVCLQMASRIAERQPLRESLLEFAHRH